MWNEVKNRFVDVWVALQGIASGAKQAAEKVFIRSKRKRSAPQGLKPTLILRRLRHD